MPLVVGRRIAQIVFFETPELANPDVTYVQSTGKYQTTNDFDELKKSWKPESMLPRMYLDREVGQSHLIHNKQDEAEKEDEAVQV